MKVDGKRAVVTGGAGGIGEAIARKLTERNCSVVISDFNTQAGEALSNELGDRAEFIGFNASDVASVERMAQHAWQNGPVDLVFANAGVSAGAPLLEATEAQFDWQFGVNVKGVWATAKAFANRMIAKDREGHLVLTGSEHSLGMQHTQMGFYTGTKHAVLGIADVLRNELPEGVKVSVFCPGIVATDLHDIDRYGVLPKSPDDARALGAMVMSKGMSAEYVAERALAGVEAEEFLIVTHPTALAAAENRYRDIKSAFETQAPMSEDAKKFEVNTILAETLAELGVEH